MLAEPQICIMHEKSMKNGDEFNPNSNSIA